MFFNKKFLYYFGLVLAIAVTAAEVLRGTHYNFLVFAGSTKAFWDGLNPYTMMHAGREFLYTPIFSVLFTPFAFIPDVIGAFAWNVFNFSLYYLAIMGLPEEYFPHKEKCKIYLFVLPLAAQTMFSFQYNLAVAYLFIIAWSLLEKDRSFWAVLLIMVSGFTKIYGIFELALLLCYPKFWKNIFYVVVTGAILLALPLVKLPFDELIPYYAGWLHALDIHQSSRVFESLFFAEPLSQFMLPHFRAIQLGSLAVVAILYILAIKKRNSPQFRVQSLGILMGWVVLMSDSAEIHTYVIAIAGLALWYWSRTTRTVLDKCLLWSNFFLFCIVPVDILCPTPVMEFITKTLWLHVWVFLFTWVRMILLTMVIQEKEHISVSPVPATDDQRSVDIVCPCYNPHPGFIEKLSESMLQIRALNPKLDIRLIVSDDGSLQGIDSVTKKKLLEKIPGSLIVENPHLGKGSAVRAGIARSDAHFTVYTDIDMPYSAHSINKIIEILLSGYDLAIATRTREYYKHLSLFRKLLSFGSKTMNRIFLGIEHCDTQGGLKGLSAKARKSMLRTKINGFLFDTEFVKYATNDGLLIMEVESQLNEDVRMSSMGLKVMLKELNNFIRIAFSK